MNQGGLKHATEPTRLDNKRERRRGAAGRAAALRRAPSDSDCSGETASLSADSGDRALRPAPPPPRSGKSRSRRRGSEWEVLEGLKDGQRFEKRPDVFNGYLHKKRKWPLKGWHKRFFVVDCGILVYARSPTDVARGRLHGSVDVGLSVLSAKARRRRIDIDADDFIYHLRAKTVDVYRTWLNVLKAHRLYRQHLLTFGARESVPKIHAPLDDLPPTDTSSRVSSIDFSTSSSNEVESISQITDLSNSQIACHNDYSVYNDKTDISLNNWHSDSTNQSGLLPLNFEPLDDRKMKFESFNRKHRSLCSMNCVALRFVKNWKRKGSVNVSQGSTDVEKQMLTDDLDRNSLLGTDPRYQSSRVDDLPINTTKEFSVKYQGKQIPTLSYGRKLESTAAYFFFTKKKVSESSDFLMRKSKKSTNLVKYRNLGEEPTLRRPLSKCVLLGKYKIKVPKKIETIKSQHRSTTCDQVPQADDEVQMKAHKSLQDMMTTSEYDQITEKLMMTVFESFAGRERGDEIKCYINQVVKDLYDVQVKSDMNPVKALFRCLLEYWLKNTSMNFFKDAMKNVKSVNIQSHEFFTKDENLSSYLIGSTNIGTQFHGLSEPLMHYYKNKPTGANKPVSKVTKTERKHPPKCNSPKRDTESFEKERRIQELERLLKNTVYVCETSHKLSKEKDIEITKTLIDNIGKLSRSRRSDFSKSNENPEQHSNSSTELPEIQETINHLISETSIPPDVAKEFLSAYLDVLLHDSSKSNISSQSSEISVEEREKEKAFDPTEKCEVNAESVVKRVSKSVTTLKNVEIKKELDVKTTNIDKTQPVDPGQLYLKDILDKITTIFSKVTKVDDKNWQNITNDKPSAVKADLKDELGRPVKEYAGKNLIYENCDENSVVIDLSKYDLEHISMFSDPAINGIMSITIKLKEKPPNFGESKKKHLSLKISDEAKPLLTGMKSDHWISYVNPTDSAAINVFKKRPIPNFKDLNDVNKESIDLKPYLSSTDTTAKSFRVTHESEHRIDLSFKSSNSIPKEPDQTLDANDETQSCYIMSLKKGTLNKFHSKKKVRLKECKGIVITPKNLNETSERYNDDVSAFDRPAPRIIDEKFILLLLENLSLLSKNVPSLHKDISNLYVKLKKKHEKVIRNCSTIHGLSLLGKIYNEESCNKTSGDNATQFESNVETTFKTVQTLKEVKHTSANTSKCFIITNSVDESLITDASELINTLIQTENVSYKIEPQVLTSKEKILMTNLAQTSSRSFSNITEIKEQATSNSNWFTEFTGECPVSTIIKSVLQSESTHDFRISRPDLRRCERDNKRRKQSPNVRQNLINEISLLSPSFKVSTQSQTPKIRFARDIKKFDTDFRIYQLFVNATFELTKSSSLTIFNGDRQMSDDLKMLYRCSSDPSHSSGLISPTSPPLRGPQAGFVSGTPGGRLASWIIESGGPLESVTRELGQAQLSVQQLQRLLDALELHHQVHHDTDVSIEGASPSVKKDRRKFGLRKKKSNSKCASVELQTSHIDPSNSHMALSALTAPPSPGGGASSVPNSAASLPIAARPQSLPAAESLTATGPASLTSLTPDHQLREDFTVLAKDLVSSLKSVLATMVCERGRLRSAMEVAEGTTSPGTAVVVALRSNLNSALQQNSELRSRLSRIHDASDLAEVSSVGPNSDAARQFQQSLSYSSSCVSASEFFDAEEHEEDGLKPSDIIADDEAGVIELDGDSSSEAGSLSSEEGSASSDNSDVLSAEQVTLRLRSEGGEGGEGGETGGRVGVGSTGWTRRTRLPAPRPDAGGPSLWNLLYKNIGKDLSQISMPVTINEPLNMLQRLCEELEYSELLDLAAGCADGVERMSLVASFAVSSYASSAHRAASKPFNPLLAETYECVRADKGFRFLAEQVSHHPPISACHAEASKWCFWQEARIKTKFWGKSMEFQPAGRVHVRLNTTGDHYTWNKVTTCVHNLFGGQRWVDQYGEMQIVAHGTDIVCKLNFVKASSWSGSRHEVRGAITEGRGGRRLRLAGRWSEALYAGDPPAARLLWRPGAMPPEHEMYYGFTRFAMELNELEPGMREALPPTDTRLRPDQRALEAGDVAGAERHKLQLEQAQRERRRERPAHHPAWFRKTMEEGEEIWVFSGEYWKAREAGFADSSLSRIW